jgi:teichuronic acid biosynthesis glycosyltransferase TuaC
VVITARGSDITLFPHYRAAAPHDPVGRQPRRRRHHRLQRLRDEVMALGVDAGARGLAAQRRRPRAVPPRPNGARPTQPFTLLTVGHLVPVKAQELIIGALPLLPGVRLVVAGDGPNRKHAGAAGAHLGVTERVDFLGAVPQAQLRGHYGAADALVLASSREGWANVLLESMACGTPVVASRVYGTPEVVAAPEAGVLMAERSPQGVADAVNALRANYPDRAATRRYAERFSWDDTTAGQLALFDRCWPHAGALPCVTPSCS